jgi:hypothetical protein
MSLPSILSTKIGTKALLAYFNKDIPGKLNIEKLSLSWFGPQKIEGFSLTDKEDFTILKFDTLLLDSHLIELTQKNPSIQSIQLKGLFAKILEEHPKLTNIHLSLGVKKMPFGLNRDKVDIHLPFAQKIALKKNTQSIEFSPKKPIIFEDVCLNCQMTKQFTPLCLVVSGKTKQEELDGSFDLQASLVKGESDKWRFNQTSELHLNSNIVNFPVDLLDLIFTSKRDPILRGFLRDALGDRLSLKVDQILTKENTSFEVVTDSPTVNASFHVEVVDGKLSLQDRGLFTFTFTPELFERFASQNKNTPFLRMVSPIKTTLVVETLSLPLDKENDFPWNVKALSFDASLDLEDAQFTGSPFWGEVAIKGVRSTLEASEEGERAEWHLRGEAHQNGRPLQIRLDASLKKPTTFEDLLERLKSESKFQFELAGVPLVQASEQKPLLIKGILTPPYCHLTLFDDPKKGVLRVDLAIGNGEIKEISLSMTELNIEAFSKVYPIPSLLEEKGMALFGKTINGRIAALLNRDSGPLKGDISGEHGILSFSGQMKNGVFTLKKPLKAFFDVTPLFAQKILSELIPVFLQAADSENRLALSIDQKGFSIPLVPFRPYFAKIDHGCLEMGKVSFKRCEEIASLIDFLEVPKADLIPVSFSPIHFKLKSGVIQIEKTNISFLDQFQLSTVGKIDLVKDKVQMSLGVTAEALKKAFGVQGLSNDFVLQLPLKGHLSEAKVDSSKALIELSALTGKEF